MTGTGGQTEEHYLYEFYEYFVSVATRLMTTGHDMVCPELRGE